MISLDNLAWLKLIQPWNIPYERFPLDALLQKSVYCVCSGFDGDPVRHLAGNFHSFIVADQQNGCRDVPDALRKHGFNGYDVLAMREITQRDLVPMQGGECLQESLCVWMILERRKYKPATLGPERFSLLYLYADGIAAYQSLYVANCKAPAAVAIIQPGIGFGGNWADMEDRQKVFARTVRENPAGKPELLLFGGSDPCDFYASPCWEEYANHVCFLDRTGGGTIGVWRLAAKR